MSKRAIIYTRFSPRKNAEECESCEVQQAYCEQYAHDHGYTVAAVRSDRALSGGDADRPGLFAAIGLLRRGDVLLVYHPYRLARDTYLAESIRRSVSRAGATIECVKGDIEGDANDPMVRAMRQIVDVIGELERRTTAQRTSDAMRRYQSEGRRMGRYIPYGWAEDPNDGKRMLKVEHEQTAIERIRELVTAGNAPGAIARTLNAEMAEAARGGEWTARTVRKIAGRL